MVILGQESVASAVGEWRRRWWQVDAGPSVSVFAGRTRFWKWRREPAVFACQRCVGSTRRGPVRGGPATGSPEGWLSPTPGSTLVAMSTIVHLSEHLADRLAAEAARRGVSVDELTAELLAAGLPAGEEVDPLEAFIGSGDSGDPSWAGRDTRDLRAEAAARRAAG